MSDFVPPLDRLRYQIRIHGLLPADWGDWLDGFTLAYTPDGATLLTSPPLDQAALHGALATVRDLGLFLEALVPVPPEAPGQSTHGR
jgi:hypothetical protein